MDFGDLINWLPLWLPFVLTVVVALLSVAVGTRLARRAIRKQMEKDPEAPMGSLVGAVLSLGYQVGMSGASRLLGTPVLALAFSLVIVMIADVDRPGEGLFRVSQQPLEDVRQMMLATQNRAGRE